jgi:transmembrane sensor
MNPRRQEEIDLKLTEQAAEWFTQLEADPDPAQQAAFARWISQSPLHIRAFLMISASERVMEEMKPETWATIPGASELGNDNVVALQSTAHRRPRARRTTPRWSVAAAAIALTAGAGWLYFSPQGVERYVTAVGEQRSIELADGSMVHLNALSRLRVRFSPRSRELRLDQGEALFTVQHDPGRPFRVLAGAVTVQALGTSFNVDRHQGHTSVAVLDGKVRVSTGGERAPASGRSDATVTDADAATGQSTRILTAGQALDVSAQGTMGPRVAAAVEQITAWRARRLVFENDTLADIAAEFNRYNRSPKIRIEDESLRQRRYAAVFDADDPESLLLFLERDPALALQRERERLVIRRRR